MADELIDICDEYNNLTGETIMKSKAHREGIWHRTAHVWIYNSQKELLLQLRAAQKELYPSMWDISAAGHVPSEEEPIEGAIREIEEEIGLQIKEDELKFSHIYQVTARYKEIINREFSYVYFLKYDGDINNLKLQKEELTDIKFMDLDYLEKDLKENPDNYVPHGEYREEVIHKVRKFND